jgi:exopolysaccharide biosynthesis WecB/TagA/CpsF family protein
VTGAVQSQRPARTRDHGDPLRLPSRHDVLGVSVSATSCEELLELLLRAASEAVPLTVDHLSVHGLAEAARDPGFATVLNGLDVLAPDGQPVRWALNRLWNTGLERRVYGPELMLRLCEGAARRGIGVYLYGGRPAVVGRLRERLLERFPSLRIVGCEAPPFRALSEPEDRALVERIEGSGAGLFFIGLGCPKQERFAFEHRERIRAVQLCVGAAFDFHAGVKPMAPRWMQDHGLEWLFRLGSEPRRLLRRYLVNNTSFAARMTGELIRCWARRQRASSMRS